MNPRRLITLLVSLGGFAAAAHARDPFEHVRTVFYIYMENHNWTQPNANVSTLPSSGIEQIKGNPAAPFINSLIDPNSPMSADVSYTNRCYNVLATPSGHNADIHPSEPNYIWQEGGSNFGVTSDADPYKDTADAHGNVFAFKNLSGLLQQHRISWHSYQEDIDLAPAAGAVNHPAAGSLTNVIAPPAEWTVPLSGFSGTSAQYANAYNGSHQYNYAPKHNGQLFFTRTNGGSLTVGNYAPSNPESLHYEPLEALEVDLARHAVARYNVISPDQYNDMHTALANGFTYNGVHYTGDAAQIAQGDNFLRTVVPMIMASDAYRNGGMIVIWNDEAEEQDATDATPDDFHHSIMEIVISPLAKGHAYHNDAITYTHSSDVITLQEIFEVGPKQGHPFLGQTMSDAAGNHDYSDLFKGDTDDVGGDHD